MREYIFIDRTRLQSYFEQLSSPNELTKTFKIPSWSASLTSKGPEIGVELSPQKRELTVYEKIKVVKKYLTEKHLLASSTEALNYQDIKDENSEPYFVLSRLEARRVLIPIQDNESLAGLDYFAIWIGEDQFPNRGNFDLYLIEMSPSPDNIGRLRKQSEYSALQFLLFDIEQKSLELRKTLLGDIDIPPNSSKFPKEKRDRCYELCADFTSNPYEYLNKMGAKIGPLKTIDCLYRTREIFASIGYNENSNVVTGYQTGVIGYPLYITESEFASSNQTITLKQDYENFFIYTPPICCSCGNLIEDKSKLFVSKEWAELQKGGSQFPLCESCGYIWHKKIKRDSSILRILLALGWGVNLGVLYLLISSSPLNVILSMIFLILGMSFAATYGNYRYHYFNFFTSEEKRIFESVEFMRTGDKVFFRFTNPLFAKYFAKTNLVYVE